MAKNLITHWHYFLASVMFYTRIPVPYGTPHSDEILNHSRLYFPLIGYLIGFICLLVYALSTISFPDSISILLMMVAGILATGAFHEDGFADSCDGFGGGWNADQVLLIMKDSRLGSYAAIGLILLFATKFFALLELAKLTLFQFSLILVSAHSLSRLFSSLLIERFNYVQDIELSKVKPITDKHLPSNYLKLTILIGLTPLLALTVMFPFAFWAACFSALSALAIGLYSRHRIGGYTGDVLGATQQVSELVFYLCLIPLFNQGLPAS